MNKLITYPLIILFVIMLVNQTRIDNEPQNSGLFSSVNQNINAESGNITQNGNSTSIEISDTTLTFDIDFITGFLAFIIGVTALGAVLGVTFLGSGISQRAQRIIFLSAVCLGLWAIFSVLTITLIMEIPMFGGMLWLSFTLIFMFGYFTEINKGGE